MAPPPGRPSRPPSEKSPAGLLLTPPGHPAQVKEKNATSSAAPPMNGVAADGSVVKPKQSKSRTGCTTCKAKRLKCGEERPQCANCTRRKVECGGYEKELKWRVFDKATIDRQVRGSPPKRKQTTPPSRTAPHHKRNTSSQSGDERRDPIDKVPTNAEISPVPARLPERLVSPNGDHIGSLWDWNTVSPLQESMDPLASMIHDLAPDVSIPGFEVHRHDFVPGALSHLQPGLGLSPTKTETLWPFNTKNPKHQDFINEELPEIFRPYDSMSSLPSPIAFEAGDGAVEYDGITSERALTNSTGLLTPTTDRGSQGPCAHAYASISLADDSPEMLTYRFDKLTCGILSMMDGPNENPWRTLMWPTAQKSPALYHAINAMVAYHSSLDIPPLRLVGLEHKLASIRFHQQGIRENSYSAQTAIATSLALGLAEAWDHYSNTGNTHIRGAQVYVQQALARHAAKPVKGAELARLKFLCNAWVYMDVMDRLTSFGDDESNDFDRFLFSDERISASRAAKVNGRPGFGVDFGIGIDARLDPLMGCAGTLFPLIGRLANLVRKVRLSTSNSPTIISEANDIKTALEAWEVPKYIETPQDETITVLHATETAEAYRWATLLHLHTAVPEVPSLSSAVLAQRSLKHLALVPLTSRTTIVHMYPLMIAGCETKTLDDRRWVRKRWRAMNSRMRLGMIDMSQQVQVEVWRRRDEWAAQSPAERRRMNPTPPVHSERQPFRKFKPSTMDDEMLGNPYHPVMLFNPEEIKESIEYDHEDDDGHSRARQRRHGRDPVMNMPDPAWTIRGRLQWIGVMWEWGWEILLG